MEDVLVKTHLIITDIHEEYSIKWCGSVIGSSPLIKNGMPVFIIRGGLGSVEMNTTDIKHIEKIAKKMTAPRGREAVTTDTAYIFLKEQDGKEKMLGAVVHNHIKTYAPMFDRIGCKKY